MKVLLLTTDAYGGHGGIAYYNRCLAEALAEMPDVEEVILLSRVMRFPPKLVPAKVRVVLDAVGEKSNYLAAALKVSKESFDLVICGHTNLLRLAAPMAICKRVPLVLQVHGIDVWKATRWLDRMWLARANAIWSVSAVTRDRMIAWSKLLKAKFTIIPNAVHLERFWLAEKSPDLVARYGLGGRKIVMTLARLAGYERYKGIDEILEVLPALAEAEPSLTYLVVGDGDDKERLMEKARALGVKDRVVFTGFIDESEKADHYRLADVFALPGRGEGFGVVFLEAMACGVPVVGSLADGSREALRDGELGELADPADPDSIRDSILRALAKPKGSPPGLAYFSWPQFRERIAAAVHSLHSTARKTA